MNATGSQAEGGQRAVEKLQIDGELVARVLKGFIHNELTKVGFTRAVINLSGGLDSTISCYLASGALGPENVMALRLPYRTSSLDSLEHAQLVIDELGIHSETTDISPLVDPLFEVSLDISPTRKGNVMARTRMSILYDRSAAWNALAIGTSNKTELLLGYGTIYGDLASAVNPLGDLYKTQIRQLAQTLGVPQAIIDKPPSADLFPGQTDEGDFGFTYERVDKLLYLMVDERYSRNEVIAAGFAESFVDTVMHMVQRSQFKRTMPIIPKLTARSIGHDFRYLRDWGT